MSMPKFGCSLPWSEYPWDFRTKQEIRQWHVKREEIRRGKREQINDFVCGNFIGVDRPDCKQLINANDQLRPGYYECPACGARHIQEGKKKKWE